MSTSDKGLSRGYTRATFIVKKDLLEQLRAVAYNNRTLLKKEVEQALIGYLALKTEGEKIKL